jgi:hypothetical protein
LTGKVKSARTKTYSANSAVQAVKDSILDDINGFGHIFITYNEVGQWLEYRRYMSDSMPVWTEILTLNEYGKPLEKTHYRYDSILHRKYDSRNDSRNDSESMLYMKGDSLTWRRTYKYNQHGGEIENIQYDAQNNPMLRTTKKYDENDNGSCYLFCQWRSKSTSCTPI